MDTIKQLEGLVLASITGMSRGSAEVMFSTTCGRRFRMYHDQDCCENVEIEDACGDVEDLIGRPILSAEERTMQGPSRYESSTWTFYELATNRGSMTLRWLGTSNGYYSESVHFEEIDAHRLACCGVLEDGVYEVETRGGREWWLWDQERWRDFAGDVLTPQEAQHRFTVLGPALRRPQ